MVTNTSWGAKRTCPKCDARFYDLGKNPAKCPKCGVEHDVTVAVKPRRGRGKAAHSNVDEGKEKKAEAKKIKKPVKEIEDIDLEEFEDIETIDAEEEIEELEEIEDIDNLEVLEKADDGKPDDENDSDATLVEGDADEVLIDNVEEDEEEEEEDSKPAKRPAPPAKDGKKKK